MYSPIGEMIDDFIRHHDESRNPRLFEDDLFPALWICSVSICDFSMPVAQQIHCKVNLCVATACWHCLPEFTTMTLKQGIQIVEVHNVINVPHYHAQDLKTLLIQKSSFDYGILDDSFGHTNDLLGKAISERERN